MKPAPLGYLRPENLAEALQALDQYGDEAKLLAGGQSLVPLLNMRLARPAWLVDLNGLTELAGVQCLDGTYRIGAMTRQRQLEVHPDLGRNVPVLCGAVSHVGHPQIRTRGTLGGSLVHADPSAELGLVAVLLDAQLHIASMHQGARSASAEQFFTGYLTTSLQATELLMDIDVPPLRSGSGWSFLEVARRHGDFALVAVAATIRLGMDGTIDEVRLAVGGAHPFPRRLNAAEALLFGAPPDHGLFKDAAAVGVASLDPDDDIHASAAYRRRLAAKLIVDSLELALQRARPVV